MKFYQLALRYLYRKITKTILLFLVLLFIGSMVLSTSMILRTAKSSKSIIQSKTKSKIVLEVKNTKNKISETEIQKISLIDGVSFINRYVYNSIFPKDFSVFTVSDSEQEDNSKIMVFSYDELENDSPFFENQYRLISGNYIDRNTKNGVVINSLLAELNELELGDTIQLMADNGDIVSARIIGIFMSGNEKKQSVSTLSVNRMENYIFVDNTTYSQLFSENGWQKAVVYVKNPEKIKALKTELDSIFSDKVVITTSDSLFKQTKAPLEQLIHVVKLMLVLTFVTGTVILTIILCMWMRTRKKETAILVSMGKSKKNILSQVLLESFLIFFVSAVGACGVGQIFAKFLKNFLITSQTSSVMTNVSLKLNDIISLFSIGSLITIIAVTFSIFPILKSNPRDTLSRMEG